MPVLPRIIRLASLPGPGLALALAACGGRAEVAPPGGAPLPALPPLPSQPALPETCAVRLPPRATPAVAASAAPPAPAPFVAPRSTLVVHGDLPLARITHEIESKVPRRVAEERDVDIGVAGRLEYTVDRGAFALHVEGDALVVAAPLQAHARACAKGRCYAGCDPEARVTARVPMRLGVDYKLRTSDVRIDVTRGCQVRALGGFVTVDVTPTLRARLAQETPRVRASIDKELPDLAPEATRLWAELGKPRPLPLGACVMLQPEEITQGPASGVSSGAPGVAPGTLDTARLRFGLLARPEVRMQCTEPPATSPLVTGRLAARRPRAHPLPPLRDDPALPPAGDVHLAVALPPDAPARAFSGAPAVLDLGRGRARVRTATGELPAGLALDLTGEACGDVTLAATGAAWIDPRGVRLTGVAPSAPGEGERLTAAGLDAAALARGVGELAIPVPVPADQLSSLLPDLARGLSDDKTTVTATAEASRPESAGLRGSEIVAVVALRGAMTIRAK